MTPRRPVGSTSVSGFYRLVGSLGRLLITAGVVVLLFVVYQLWGTGLREAQAQDDLTEAFARATASVLAAPAAPGEPAAPAAPAEVPAPLPPPQGEAVAIIRIPKIDIEKTVVEGVGVADLKKAPGHYPQTPMPGQPGNAAIAGHRTTYGAPFFELDQLEVGDEILVRTLQGEFRYEVDRKMVVRPTQVEVLDPTEEARLTLTTCNPRFSAAERLIVSAVLRGDPAPAPEMTPPEPLVSEPSPADPLGADPSTREPDSDELASIDGGALVGDSSARVPAVLWGLLAGAVWLATNFIARTWKRWPAYLVGVPVVLVVLFVCFEQVGRLFPANI